MINTDQKQGIRGIEEKMGMNCSTKDCPNKANWENTDCGHIDYQCDCHLEPPICDACYDRACAESYDFMEAMSNPYFNKFYIAHLDEETLADDFYMGYLESLARS